jgi:putative glutamine amidotransferase
MTCRAFRELNVALGGTLKHEQEDLPEWKKHGTPKSAKTEDERFRIRQELNVPQVKQHPSRFSTHPNCGSINVVHSCDPGG